MGASAGPDVIDTGLVLALDGADKNSYKTDNNLLDLSTWYVGATSVTGFGFNGASSENALIADTDPFGNTAVIWKAYNPGGSADGGWNTDYIDVDHTKLYRFSVWVNRKVTGTDGRFYFGVRGYDSSDTNVGVLYRVSGTNNTNPYFYYSSEPPTSAELPEDEWVLVVGHVWPSGSGTGSNKQDTGIYNADGTKRSITTPNNPYDFVWNTTVTKTVHRSYLFYSENDASVIQHWAYPRIDLVDGTEPSIDDLINNRVNSRYSYDLSGKSNHAVLFGTTSYSSFPSIFETNATSRTDQNYLTTQQITFADGSEYTFDYWVKLNGLADATYNSLTGRNSTNPWISLYPTNTNGTSWNIRYRQSGGTYYNTSNISYDIKNNWGNITLSVDSSRNVRVYLNGEFQETVNPTTTLFYVSVIAGGYSSGGNYYALQGSIASSKIYNKALTASEIQQNFNALRGRFGI
jgi:hypothetical protein